MSQRLKNISKSLQAQNRILHLRNNSQLNGKQLVNSIFPEEISKHFDAIYQVIRDNPDIFQHANIEELNRQEERNLGIRQALKIMRSLNFDMKKDPIKYQAATYIYNFFGFGQSIKTFLHYILYIKTLILFKTNEFHEKQLQRAINLQDFGSFSLTQLHHGSFSRGISTQAQYDHKTKSFIINTFGQKGMKFWIGSAYQTATKTILWAQLIVNDTNYGPHPFIMQLRDQKTHEVLKGIIIGDCGVKNGANVIDNGYIIIKDFQIPSKALLGKLGYVDESGQYISKIKTNEQRFGLHMSPLSSGRAGLSSSVLTQPMAALTIALRYVCIRRQFKVNQNQGQVLLIDYPMTRYRLMVPLATNVVYYFGAIRTNSLYVQNNENFTDPSKKIIAQIHAISAVLKVKGTWFASQTITECREMLGGHGYSSFSALGRYYNDNDVNTTWQGDNNLLLQQTSKYLLKKINSNSKASVLSLQFVHEGVKSTEPTEQSLTNLDELKILLQDVFIHRYNAAAKQMENLRDQILQKDGDPQNMQMQIWNQVQPFFCNQMALAYGDLIYFESLQRVLNNYKGSEANKKFLTACLQLWTQSVLLKNSFHSLSTKRILQKLIIEGCQLIYPDCIKATDALSAPSYVIGSPFAEQDGQGMKQYINLLFSGKKTFRRVPWFQKLIKLKQQN